MGYNARPNLPNKYEQGYYKLINESKYISDPNKIVYRSSLEKKFCTFIDKNPKVLKWGSEIIGIPYKTDTMHTYYIDFYVEIINENNPAGYDRLLIEVKPSQEVERIVKNQPPPKPQKSTPKSLRNWEYSIKEFVKNKHKWVSAQNYARVKGMTFLIVTEKTLNNLV